MNALILNDRRVWIAGVVFAVICIITSYFYYNAPALSKVSEFPGAVFASWVAGLFLTLGLSSILFVLQLPRPDLDPFETRARNFLQGQKGPHINYAIEQLGKALEPYCAQLEKRLTVIDYDEQEKLFYVNMQTLNILKGFLSDKNPDFPGQIAYENATVNSKSNKSNRLHYVKIDNTQHGDGEDFLDQFARTYVTEIVPDKECKIEHRMSFWLREGDEPNRHKPVRFTNSISVHIQNETKHLLIVEMMKADNISSTIKIPVSESRLVVSCLSQKPYQFAYDFRLRKG